MRICFTALLLALGLAGCEKAPPPLTPVEGVVTINGQPLPHAEISFAPTIEGFGAEIMSAAVTDEHGRFILTCGEKVGASVCEHRVTVAEGPIPDKFRGMSAEAQIGAGKFQASLKNRPIPSEYGNFAQSPLKVIVTAGQKEYKLELRRKGALEK